MKRLKFGRYRVLGNADKKFLEFGGSLFRFGKAARFLFAKAVSLVLFDEAG